MSGKKIFVVFGATGNQGGSIINSVLADPKASQEFQLRGLTRDASSSKAKALTEKGVECMSADLSDKASLNKAFKDAHSVFAVTNYWEKMDGKLELQQGKNVADAAKEEGVQHLIFSTLYNINDLTNGKYPHVYHFDAKADIEAYIRSLGIPSSFFMAGFYLSNLSSMIMPPSQPSQSYTLALPMPSTTPIPFFDAVADSGKFVKAMVMKREEVLGKNVLGATDYYTPEDVVKVFKEKKEGKEVGLYRPDKQTYMGFLAQAGMPEFAQEEMYENMAFMDEFGYYGKQDLGWSHSILDEKLTTLADFMPTLNV